MPEPIFGQFVPNQNPQTSFIPKKPLDSVKVARGSAFGFIFVVALVIFIISLALSAGVFFYEQFLKQDIASKAESLKRAEEAFETNTIKEIARLDKRIKVTQELLSNHLALSPLFDALETNTLKTVRFESFEFNLSEKNEFVISMRGEADSFAAIVLQSDELRKTNVIKNPVFSDLSPNVRGKINFLFTATVDPALVSYGLKLGGSEVPNPQQ